MLGEPRPAETNKVVGTPSYVHEHVRIHNEKAGGQTARMGKMGMMLGSLFGR